MSEDVIFVTDVAGGDDGPVRVRRAVYRYVAGRLTEVIDLGWV
jgi:hypothetical protein